MVDCPWSMANGNKRGLKNIEVLRVGLPTELNKKIHDKKYL